MSSYGGYMSPYSASPYGFHAANPYHHYATTAAGFSPYSHYNPYNAFNTYNGGYMPQAAGYFNRLAIGLTYHKHST